MNDTRMIIIANRYFKIAIIICVLALLLSPFLPWLGITRKAQKEDSDKEIRVTYYYSDSTINIFADYGSYGDTQDALEDLSDNIAWVITFLWLTLIFLFLGYLGVIFYKVGRRFRTFGKILMLVGCFALIFAILCVIFNGFCFINVMELQDATEDQYGSSAYGDVPEYFLGYNYAPLIGSLLLMFIGIFLMRRVFRPITHSLRGYYHPYPPQPYESNAYRAPRPPPEEERFRCSNCSAPISLGMVYCSRCGANVLPPPPSF